MAPATYAGYLIRFRPGSNTDSRYLFYCSQSAFFQAAIEADAITSTISNFNADRYAGISCPLHPLAEQRAIADYLDVETARIDALIAKKQQLIHLLEERLTDFVETALFASEKRTRLDRLTDDSRQIMYGIVLPGPDVGTGVAIVKGGNVRNHRIQGHVCHTTHEIAAPYTRSQLRAGDLAIIIRGAGAGRVANVSAEHNGWNITQDVARVAPARGVRSDWLRHVLEARPVQAQLKVRVGGATITGINIWDLKRLEVPDASTMEQELVSQQINEAESSSLATTAALARQIELLAERRQALITAAVTGEFTVPGAP
jgi:type I restriction enzyme S subunit